MHNPHRLLCAATHCSIRARHKPECDNTDGRCWGCLPRPAADGLRLCDVDTRRIGEDAAKGADLHAALAGSIIRAGNAEGEKTTGSSTGAPVPDDEVVAARSRIRGSLLAVVRLISQERGVSYPTERYTEPLPGGFVGPPRELARVSEALPAAALMIGRHREWVAAHPRYAAPIANDLRAIAGDGRLWALAYPCGSDRLYVGDCPAILTADDESESLCGRRLYQYPNQPLIRCDGCGIEETIEQWRRWIVGDATGRVDVYAVAAHLAVTWMRPVDPQLVKKWSQRGHIQPVTEPAPDDPDKRRIVRDDRNRTLYVLAECVSYAEHLWGAPARLRRAS